MPSLWVPITAGAIAVGTCHRGCPLLLVPSQWVSVTGGVCLCGCSSLWVPIAAGAALRQAASPWVGSAVMRVLCSQSGKLSARCPAQRWCCGTGVTDPLGSQPPNSRLGPPASLLSSPALCSHKLFLFASLLSLQAALINTSNIKASFSYSQGEGDPVNFAACV